MNFDSISVFSLNGKVEVNLFSNGSLLTPGFEFLNEKLIYDTNLIGENSDYVKTLGEAKAILEEYIPTEYNSLVELIQKEVDVIVKDKLDQYDCELEIMNEKDPKRTTYKFEYQDLRNQKNIVTFRKAQHPCFLVITSFMYKDKKIEITFFTTDENIIKKEENQKFINYLYENKLVK